MSGGPLHPPRLPGVVQLRAADAGRQPDQRQDRIGLRHPLVRLATDSLALVSRHVDLAEDRSGRNRPQRGIPRGVGDRSKPKRLRSPEARSMISIPAHRGTTARGAVLDPCLDEALQDPWANGRRDPSQRLRLEKLSTASPTGCRVKHLGSEAAPRRERPRAELGAGPVAQQFRSRSRAARRPRAWPMPEMQCQRSDDPMRCRDAEPIRRPGARAVRPRRPRS